MRAAWCRLGFDEEVSHTGGAVGNRAPVEPRALLSFNRKCTTTNWLVRVCAIRADINWRCYMVSTLLTVLYSARPPRLRGILFCEPELLSLITAFKKNLPCDLGFIHLIYFLFWRLRWASDAEARLPLTSGTCDQYACCCWSSCLQGSGGGSRMSRQQSIWRRWSSSPSAHRDRRTEGRKSLLAVTLATPSCSRRWRAATEREPRRS